MTVEISAGGGATVTKKKKTNKTSGNRTGHVSLPTGTKYIQFSGFWNGFTQSFQVSPAPDSGPIITGGFPIINVIPRPQRVSLTVPAGYDPVTIDIPVLFDCWSSPTRYSDAQDIEVSISKLEWMYGRGVYGGGTKGGAVGVGAPPTVQIATVNTRGQAIPLLSSNYQTIVAGATSSITSPGLSNGGAIDYEIASISWDANPLRVPADQNFGGCRMRQLATISVQQIVSDPYITTPGTNVSVSGTTQVYVTRKGDTYLSIARQHVPSGSSASQTTAVATAIMATNSDNRKLVRGLSAVQPAGQTVSITAADKAAT